MQTKIQTLYDEITHELGILKTDNYKNQFLDNL